MTAPARPPIGPQRPYHFPRFTRVGLPNGINVLVAPLHRLPLVSVGVRMEGGGVCDASSQEGLARITGMALLEGTARDDGAAFAERMEGLGTAIDCGTDWYASSCGLTAAREHLAAGVEALAEMVRSPRLPEKEINRLRDERLADLLQEVDEPRGLANTWFSHILYDASSRFRRPLGGTRASVARITRDGVDEFHRQSFDPARATLIFAGDVTVEEAVARTTESFGDWRSNGAGERSATTPVPAPSRGVHLVVKAEAAQSELRLGQVSIPRLHADFYPAVVMNAILGGLFNSRINLNLREAHGYTYGASSAFEWRREGSPFAISSAVRSDATVDAIREVLTEVDRMRTELVREDELTLAQNYLQGVFPIRFETTDALASALETLVDFDLPETYYDEYRDHVGAVTREEILRVAQTHLTPEHFQITVVGEEGLRDALARLDRGEVAVHLAETAPSE